LDSSGRGVGVGSPADSLRASACAGHGPAPLGLGVDREAALGIGGAVQFVILGGELGEILGFFVEHDLVDGVDAVLQGVESGSGLTCGGARFGRFLRVGAAGRALFGSGLKQGRVLDLTLAGVFGAGGRPRGLSA
jgi:hypothetical protein